MGNSKTKVIIVGNGSSLNGSKKGELIDSFDKVVRLNKYLIEGHEEDVGSKTDVCMLNCKAFVNHFSDDDMADRLISLEKVFAIIRGDRELSEYIDVKEAHPIGRIAVGLLERYDNMEAFDRTLLHLFHDILGIKTPCIACERSSELIITTGLYAIGYYIKEGYDVSIIGFDSMDLKMKIDEHGWDIPIDKLLHYQGHGLLNVDLEHKIFEEGRWLRGMVGLGIITRLDG